MDTATIEDRSVEDLKEIITRIGGWPVVEGGAWKEDNFKWWDLSMRAAEEGFRTDRMISIGKNIYNAHSPKAQTTFMMKTIIHPPRTEEETKGRPHIFSAKTNKNIKVTQQIQRTQKDELLRLISSILD